MNFRFQEFPRSYRWSQIGIGLALTASAIGGTAFQQCPEKIKIVAVSILGAMVVVCLLISHYVIIRYPYISLVESEDGDMFSRHFPTAGSALYLILKAVGLMLPLTLMVGCWATGFQNAASKFIFVYCLFLFFFLVHFTFFYNSLKHPTIATFIRSTLGLGIPLYPLYGLTIAIGSWRCRSLLDGATARDRN